MFGVLAQEFQLFLKFDLNRTRELLISTPECFREDNLNLCHLTRQSLDRHSVQMHLLHGPEFFITQLNGASLTLPVNYKFNILIGQNQGQFLILSFPISGKYIITFWKSAIYCVFSIGN